MHRSDSIYRLVLSYFPNYSRNQLKNLEEVCEGVSGIGRMKSYLRWSLLAEGVKKLVNRGKYLFFVIFIFIYFSFSLFLRFKIFKI